MESKIHISRNAVWNMSFIKILYSLLRETSDELREPLFIHIPIRTHTCDGIDIVFNADVNLAV